MTSKSSTPPALYFPKNWTHLFLGFPASPRVKKAIQTSIHAMAREFDLQITPLPSSTLYVLLRDFQICPYEALSPISTALQKIKEHHSIFKLSPKKWVVETHEGISYLWLELKDQYEQFKAIQSSLNQELLRSGFNDLSPSSPKILCATLDSVLKIDRYETPRVPVWNNEIKILQRPQVYFPQRGYSCVGSIELPKESNFTSSDELVLSSLQDTLNETDPHHSEILTLLETRLAERLAEKQHSLHKNFSRKRRRRPRKRENRKVQG